MSTFSTIISYIKASMPELNSGSVAAIINKIAEAVGQAIDNTLTELNNTYTLITNIIVNKNFGHTQYYTDYALMYQEGVDLIIDSVTKKLYYATIDTNKQIIKQAAFEEVVTGNSASLVLKVAYTDPDTGLLAKLPTDKKTAFDSYFSNFEIPGLPVAKISNDPNILTFDALITYDKNFDLTTIQNNWATALISLRDTFQFNGVFYNYYFENYIVTNIPGVLSVYLSNTKIDTVAFNGSTKLSAGYFNYGTPLNLTYANI